MSASRLRGLSALGLWNNDMQRVDAGYLYEIGDAVRRVRSYRMRDWQAFEIWGPLAHCRHTLEAFLANSVYTPGLRPVVNFNGSKFIEAIDSLLERITSEQLQQVTSLDQYAIGEAYDRFEPVLAAELSSLVIFHVVPKGAFDVVKLVEQGSMLFPQSVHLKAPEAVRDIEEGAKALAFELWTGAAFHFHRATEAVLRRYFDLCCGDGKRPTICTMGTMLSKLEKCEAADKPVVIALQNIKEFHRNPNSHPGKFVEEAEEAMSLVAASRAAMGYMLDKLPVLDLAELVLPATESLLAIPQNVSAAPQ